MADDLSPDVTTLSDDDIADEPLFDAPVTASTVIEAPSDTSEEATNEAEDTKDAETTDEAKAEAKDTEATETTEAKAEEAQQTDEAPKGQPDPQAARQAYLERQQTRRAVEQQIDNAYAPKSQDDLYQENIDKGMDEQQAEAQAQIQALREEMQYDKQRTYIAELNAGMQAEAVNAMSDFPVFNEKSPEYDADFTKMVESQYQKAARLQYDDNGIILNAEEPLYDFYQQAWNIYNRGASKGATKAQAETTETLSRVESVAGGSSSTSRGPETLEEMGERLANMPLI
jgi:hypothetical protein